MTIDLTRPFLVALALGATTLSGHAQTAPASGAAGGPTLLVQSRDWNAFTSASGAAKTCYAIASPQKKEPATLDHGNVFFFISTRLADKIQNEPSFQVGYAFKEGSQVLIDIDGAKFTLFTKGDGAWIDGTAEEQKLVAAMKKGRQLTAQGTSRRGNATTYAFSLAGISGALDAVAKECK